MSNKLIEALKKQHSAMAIEVKDYSLQDLFDKNTKEVTLEVIGFASKFVPKYKKETNPGFHTMIYLKNGEKTGAFSGALLEFAQFFYGQVGLDPEDKFNKVMFAGSIQVKVSLVKLDEGRKTYNFEIIDGDVTGAERIGQASGGGIALLPEKTEPQEEAKEEEKAPDKTSKK